MINEWVLMQVAAMRFSYRQKFWRNLETKLPKAATGERVAWPDGLLYLSDSNWEEALQMTINEEAK